MQEFFSQHWEIAVAFIGILWTTLMASLYSHNKQIGNRISELDETDKKLVARVDKVENTLIEYKEHIGAGDKMLSQLFDRVEKHMEEEEKEVWEGIRELTVKINEIALENVKAHSDIIQGRSSLIERVATLEAQANGSLKEVTRLLRELTQDQDRRYHEKTRSERP